LARGSLVGAAISRGAGDDRLRLLLDSLADYAIFMIGPQEMVLTWNEGAARIKGYAAQEIIGQQFSVFYPPEAVAAGQPRRELEAAIANGRHEDEGWRVRQDGSQFWANVVITPMHDREGRLRGFGTVTRDLSERLRADDLFAVLDAAVDPIFGIDDDGRIIFTNSAGRQAFGYRTAELVGLPLERLLPSMVHEATPLPEDSTLPGGAGYLRHEPRLTVTGLELDGVRKDGSVFLAEVSLAAVTTARGGVVTATVRDVTERRAAEESLQLSQQRLRRSESELRATLDAFTGVLAVTTEQAIVVTDAAGRITFYNRGAELMLGQPSRAILGQQLSVLHDPLELTAMATLVGLPADSDPMADYLQLAAGGPPRHWTYLTAGGHRRSVSVTVTAVGDPYQPSGYVEIITDR
jgi:PAS domain S-box-containing protein